MKRISKVIDLLWLIDELLEEQRLAQKGYGDFINHQGVQ